jgi:hypothetical protein
MEVAMHRYTPRLTGRAARPARNACCEDSVSCPACEEASVCPHRECPSCDTGMQVCMTCRRDGFLLAELEPWRGDLSDLEWRATLDALVIVYALDDDSHRYRCADCAAAAAHEAECEGPSWCEARQFHDGERRSA